LKLDEQSLESVLKPSIEKYLDVNSAVYTENLNKTFKRFVESDKAEFLDNFETAVIFIMKRKEHNQSQLLDDICNKQNEHITLINHLSEELKKIKTTNKQFKIQIETIGDKLNALEMEKLANTNKFDTINKKKKNRRCIIS